MSSSVHGLLGPSGCTRSKQKRLGDLIERERRARPLSFFYFAVCCYHSFELMSDFSFFFCSPSVSQTLRKAKANHLLKMWYGFPSFMLSVVCSSSAFLALFIYDVLMLVVCAAVFIFFFRRKFLLLQLVGLWRKKWL